MILRSFLRNNDLSPLFAKAGAMLHPGWGIGLVRAGRLLAAHGLDESVLEQANAVPFSVPFMADGHPAGHVIVAPSHGAADHLAIQNAQQVAEFTAQSLEMLLKQEEARRALAVDTLQKYRELSLLHRATEGLNGSLRLRQVGRSLLDECRLGAVPTEMGMVLLRDDADHLATLSTFGPAGPMGLERITESTLFCDIMRSGKCELVSDLDADKRWHGEVPGLKALLVAPIMAAGTLAGALVLATARDAHLEAKHLQYVTTLTTVAGTAMGNAVHFEGMQNLLKALLQALATAIDARDPFTAGHSHRVARLAVALARVMHEDDTLFTDVRFDDNDLAEIYYAGLLHDVGKIGVREQVLTKACRLADQHIQVIGMRMALHAEVTGQPWESDFEHLRRINRSDTVSRDDAALVAHLAAQEISAYGKAVPMLSERESLALLVPRGNLLPEERREIERHPAESYRILQHIPFPRSMSRLLDVIGQHHERLDGSGYPAGLKDDQISLLARLLMIVDIYDAITMERHYKPALPREKAILVIEEEAAMGKLDEKLVRLMSLHLDEIEEMAAEKDFESVMPGHGQP